MRNRFSLCLEQKVDESDLLLSPLNLSTKLPLMPYFNSENFGLELEKFYNLRDQLERIC